MDRTDALILSTTIVGLGVCGAVGVACYKTRSALPLLGLMFLPTLKITTSNN